MTVKLFKKSVETIIWDWNGTLLNDLELCVESINSLLANRNLAPLTPKKYREVFTFPVKDYYEKAGFDFAKEDFAIPAHEFIDLYNSKVKNCSLHQNVIPILEQFKINGINQFILSATKQDNLEETLKHNSIFDFFEGVVGLNDHYAVSKIERGEQLISGNKIVKETSVIIGDTIHDFEVAKELGIDCILIANGHQSKQRLKSTGALVLNSINELL